MMGRSVPSSSCGRLAPAVETYLDGELAPQQMVDVETHLAECSGCRERVALDRAVRVTLKRQTTPAPASLRDRVVAAMAEERAAIEAEEARASTPPPAPAGSSSPPRVLALEPRHVLPFAVAAGFALFFTMRQNAATTQPAAAASLNSASAMGVGVDSFLDDLVAQHARPLPPEITREGDIHAFDPFVGVPVEAPQFKGFGAKWIGGRVTPVDRDQRAAMLQYTFAGDHRVTVYVYDPNRVHPDSTSRLSRRMVRDAPVWVGKVRGYNVAAAEKRGVGYALASDLDEAESGELVAAAAVPLGLTPGGAAPPPSVPPPRAGEGS